MDETEMAERMADICQAFEFACVAFCRGDVEEHAKWGEIHRALGELYFHRQEGGLIH